jgi:hypothetical protein
MSSFYFLQQKHVFILFYPKKNMLPYISNSVMLVVSEARFFIHIKKYITMHQETVTSR